MKKIINELKNEVGTETICHTFDAISDYLQLQVFLAQENGEDTELLREINARVYSLCQKGKAEVRLLT